MEKQNSFIEKIYNLKSILRNILVPNRMRSQIKKYHIYWDFRGNIERLENNGRNLQETSEL